MYSVSDRFLQRIGASGKVKTVVDLYFDGELVAADIPVAAGQIRCSRDSDSRRSGSLTIADPTLVPAIKSDILIPYGTEIQIRSGMVYPDGEELIPMGIFSLEETQWDEGKSSISEIQFFDRTKAMQRFFLPNVYDASGQLVVNLLSTLPGLTFPGGGVTVTVDPSLANPKLLGGTTYDTNHWDIMTTLAEIIGAEVYFDVDGNIQVVPIPYIDSSTPNSAADWTVGVGDNGVLINARRGISRADTYNSVLVRGGTKANGKQAWSQSYDLNPASPTYYNGPFGRARKVIENSALITDGDCYNLAIAELRKVTGLAKSVAFTSLRNPALEVGDIILFEFFNGETELHILDSYTFDFTSGEMQADTRSQVVSI